MKTSIFFFSILAAIAAANTTTDKLNNKPSPTLKDNTNTLVRKATPTVESETTPTILERETESTGEPRVKVAQYQRKRIAWSWQHILFTPIDVSTNINSIDLADPRHSSAVHELHISAASNKTDSTASKTRVCTHRDTPISQARLQRHSMANKFKVDHTAFHHVDLTRRWRETRTVQEQARLTERHESHLETALQMPMYKNLPTGGLNYDWKQFRNHEGMFVRIKGSDPLNHYIGSHVNHLSTEEMDAFCANVFDKATEFLENLSKASAEAFWVKVAQEFGIRIRQGTVETVAFWDWAMKLVAARILYGQEQSHEELLALSESDASGDIDMSDDPNSDESDPKSLSLTAQAVDNFLAVGIPKYGARPKKLKAITRHHTPIPGCKLGPGEPSKMDFDPARKDTKNAQVHNSYLPVDLTATTGNTTHLQISAFGSHIGAGGPAWWGSINQVQSPRDIPRHGWTPTELQRQEVTARDSSGQAGTLDDLAIGIHGTMIEDSTNAPQFLTNLAIRTVNPLKRRHDDEEGAEDVTIDGQPLAKIPKVSKGHFETSGSPS